MKRVTVRDVAGAAGVSPSAVVLALNGKPGLGPDTRERILRTAEQMGYVRGGRGRGNGGRSRNVHYVLPRYLLDVDRASEPIYHDLLMSAVEKHCRKSGYFMVVHYLGDQPGEREAIIANIKSAEDNPMVIVQAADIEDETALRWKTEIRRVVFLNKHFEEIPVDSVASDGKAALYSATEYLLQCGYTEIGHLKGRTYFKNLEDRQEGYLRCLERNRIQSAGTWLVHTSYEQAYRDVWNYLQQGVRFPRAVVCDGDRQAMGAIRAFREYGIRVPDDVAVMGFDDLPMSAHHEPPLSTCSVSWDEMARLAVRRVLEKTGEEGEYPLKICVGAILRKRNTT